MTSLVEEEVEAQLDLGPQPVTVVIPKEPEEKAESSARAGQDEDFTEVEEEIDCSAEAKK